MNSLEMDLKRAICSKGFLAGLVLELIILFQSGFDSNLYRTCVPVAAAFPYATAWLWEYQSGFLKAYLPRTGVTPYILGKFFACGLSGGLVELLACRIFQIFSQDGAQINLTLVFASGMFWALAAALLAAWSKSRYIAYGGGFVIYYLLVMLYERYLGGLYCLYPYEWFAPVHTWVFGDSGILLLLAGLGLVLLCLYYEILWRCIQRV